MGSCIKAERNEDLLTTPNPTKKDTFRSHKDLNKAHFGLAID